MQDIQYSIHFIDLPETPVTFQWVGGQWVDGAFYAIPNDMNAALLYRDGALSLLPGDHDGRFKWTGGAVYNGSLCGFPRNANSFYILDLASGKSRELPLDFTYPEEHHYGGVMTENGVVYQPPRGTDHILVTDLNTGRSRKLTIVPGKALRYCGSVLHPNGYIYFLPEGGFPVLRLDPGDETMTTLPGDDIHSVFNAAVWEDGNIYGFSTGAGILRIDTEKDAAEMLHTDVTFGAYGTKRGVNGKLYSVPGNGDKLWEYDPRTDGLRVFYDLRDGSQAKFAGGAVSPEGVIAFTPAAGHRFMLLTPDRPVSVPEEEYKEVWRDFY